MTIAFTFFTFGFQVLFERLCEWETLIPKVISFPQYSHFAISEHLLTNLQRIDINTNNIKMQVFFYNILKKRKFVLFFILFIDFSYYIYYNYIGKLKEDIIYGY